MLESNTDRMWFLIGILIVTTVAVLLGVRNMPGGMSDLGSVFAERASGSQQYNELRIVSVGWDTKDPVSNIQGYGNVYSLSAHKEAKGSHLKEHAIVPTKLPRGLTLFIFDDEDNLEFKRTYDIHSSATNARDLADKIASVTDESKVMVVVLADAINTTADQGRHLTHGLEAAMLSLGASPEIYSELEYREPYVLVGKPRLGEGNGHERTAPRYGIVDFKVSISEGWSRALQQTSQANGAKGNLLPSTAVFDIANSSRMYNETAFSFESNAWAATVLPRTWVQANIKPNTQYLVQYDVKLLRKPTENIRSQAVGAFSLYKNAAAGDPWGPNVYFGGIGLSEYGRMKEGDTTKVSDYFITPEDVSQRHVLLYTAMENADTGNKIAEMEFSNFRLVEVNK